MLFWEISSIYYVSAIVILLMICFAPYFGKVKENLNPLDKERSFELKGLFIILLVFYHSLSGVSIPNVMGFGADLGLLVTSGFFFITGYGLCVSYKKKRDAYIKGFIKNRLGRILPKFILLSLGMVLYYYWCEGISLDVQLSRFIIYKYVPLKFSWFVYVIIFVYLVFYLSALVFKKPGYVGAAITIVLILYYFSTSHLLFGFQHFWYQTIMAVSVGYYIALYEDKISTLIVKNKTTVLISLCLGLVIIMSGRLYVLNNPDEFGYKWGYVINDKLHQLCSLFEIASVYVLIRYIGFPRIEPLRRLGILSLEIYLIHGFALDIAHCFGLSNLSFILVSLILSVFLAVILEKAFDFVLVSVLAILNRNVTE